MASIYGFTVKGVKYFQGRDWEGCQGDMYYNGKKVGFYNDLGDGAPATIDLCAGDGERNRINGLLQDAVDKYYKRFPLEEEYARLEPDAEMFIAKLIGLTEDEKEYKKFRKQIFEKTGHHPAVIAFYTRHKPFGSFMQVIKSDEDAEKLKTDKNYSQVRIYKSPDDFIIK